MSNMLTHRARHLRRNLTDAERLLWRHLRNRQMRGYKFRRQVAIGPYIVDFVCIEAQLAIEADGGQHAQQTGYDTNRTRWLESRGYRILRFWNHEILGSLPQVLERISMALEEQ